MMLKGFSLGAVMMSIFTFTITGVFSWMGLKTVNNSEQNIRLASTNIAVVKAINRLNVTLEKITDRIIKVEESEHSLGDRVIKIEEHLKYIGSSQ